jgi:hypothetical protein
VLETYGFSPFVQKQAPKRTQVVEQTTAGLDVLFEFFATCTELTGERRGGVRFENWPLRQYRIGRSASPHLEPETKGRDTPERSRCCQTASQSYGPRENACATGLAGHSSLTVIRPEDQ